MKGIFGKARYVFAATFIIGVAPEFYGMWAVWRCLSFVFPAWIYQWGDDKLYSIYQRMVLFFFEFCTQVEVILYDGAEEILKKKEKILYLSNHQSTADWLVGNMVAVRANSIGHLRYVMKDILKFIPLYGHYFYSHGCIYVKRGKFAQGKMVESLKYLRNENINTWLVIFPEGTRYFPSDTNNIKKSEEYAKENNLEVLKYHLTPKSKGTWLALEYIHNNFDAIYDTTVVYENAVDENGVRQNAPQLADFLIGKCPRIHIHIRRIPMTEVPSTEKELKPWMHDLFVKKDKFIEPFFSKDKKVRVEIERRLGGHVSRLSLWSTLPSMMLFSVVSIPLAFTTIGQQFYTSLVMYGSLTSYSWLAFKSVC